MNTSEIQTHKGYTAIKSIFRNERNEIILANRISDGRKVVLKQSLFLNENILKVSKLGHEYDILKDLDHVGIPKVYEVSYDGKTVALIQEYIEGTNLRTQIFNKKPGIAEVLNLAIQLADILHYMHQKGVIHKDINSSNIMLTSDGKLKLLDFGISTSLNSETNEILNVDQIEGTLIYISPEQTGRTAYSVTHSCDFYSFGVLLYELLAGKVPFDSVDPLEVIHFHLSRNPIPLSSIIPDLPGGFDQVISKLMEKNPDDRYHSAAGLKADLETIKKHFISKEPLINFKAGLYDLTGHYKQNQKLYGRENEINELLNYFKNLSVLKSMLVLVAGYSGVGKSALIRHIKYPIIQNHGTFISGKFDQFKKDIPYYAFIEAIQEFIKNLLAEPEDKILAWKQRITTVLGDNAGLITEVIPQLSKIIDKQPAVPKLQPAEQESRFHMVLLDFIYVFSSSGSPLVIFLDDLQWADLPSLNLVKRILENPRQDSILILGAYRDNEVEKGHPLLITLKQINESKGLVKEIQIKPLSEETTCQITADSYGMNEVQADELGGHVYAKTKGNPFFIHNFLKSLYDKKLVKNDPVKNWIWNHKEIDDLGYTDNVIDLMTDGLINLPNHTQEVLKYASVLGNTFNLADLADITEKSQSEVYHDLKPAIKEGYLNSIDNKYRSLSLSSIGTNYSIENQFSAETAQFTFTHDKVQQAAYSLITSPELAPMHLRIGRLLLQNRNELQLQESIFELLNHFAISSHLIENEEEKKRITELCLIAGRKSKDSTSYNLGVHFLKMGKTLLGPTSWNDNYDLTFNTLKELGECEYLNDNPTVAEQYFKEILSYSRTNFEKLKVYYLHSSLYLKIGNSNESLRLGLEAANLYNIRFPKSKNAIQVAALFTLAKYLFLFSTKYRNPESLFNLKDCTDEEIIALNKFLIDLATSAYQQDQNLMMLVIFRIVKLYIKEGFTDASGWGFSGFSVVVLSALKMQKRGFNLWDITMKLHQRTHSPLIKWRLSYTVLCFHNHWRIPIRKGYDSILETIKACVLNGDQIFTSYTVALYLRSRFIAGENLREILESSEDHLTLIKSAKGGLDFFQCFHQLVKALNGQTNGNNWDDDSFNGAETLERLYQEGNKTKLAFFHSAKFYFLYFSGQYKAALDESRIVLDYSDNFVGDLLEASHAFYTSLTISAIYEDLSPDEKKKYLKVFNKHLKDMKMWTIGCHENFSQHYYLLQAELFALNDKFETALQFYEKAIKLAAQNRFKYVEAIANERAALLCSKRQMTKQSQIYLEDAWEAYNNWGAHAKCKQLENTYPELLKVKSVRAESDSKFGVFTVTSGSSKIALDLASVLKASQSIASQVKYDDLLKKLMHITIENAGAGRGCLLLYKGNQLCIEAVGRTGTDDIEIFPSVPLDQMNILPNSILNYCWRTEESVVVNDALAEERFSADPYIQENKILSILCLPISSLGKINGLLYLENSLLKGVFNKNRIELLQMLSGQIGISIQNAILYENLEGKVLERTKEIEKAYTELKTTQAQLIQSEKMASLGELTAGIAHEIQNPLNFVNNFSEVSTELLDEMKDEIVAGNWQQVTEIADDVKQNLGKILHHGKRADAIVKGMLQHSRTSSGQKEPTDINALADECLQLAYHGLRAKDINFNATLKTDFDESIGNINIIPQDIGRVILNLITNAFYAIAPPPPTGGIKNAQTDYNPTVTVRTSSWNLPSGGRGALISVKDNGPGIPPQILDKIFQPFFTTKPTGQGTGLGLSLAYDIVKAHGGELSVETKEGVGTEFTVALPV
ncbi:MAG: AAA family ATPase [Prolixibacteraceae bacterium]|nr:AAA family ATPase [Prolixibacteraceae bacterium]